MIESGSDKYVSNSWEPRRAQVPEASAELFRVRTAGVICAVEARPSTVTECLTLDDWLKKCCNRLGLKLADQNEVSRDKIVSNMMAEDDFNPRVQIWWLFHGHNWQSTRHCVVVASRWDNSRAKLCGFNWWCWQPKSEDVGRKFMCFCANWPSESKSRTSSLPSSSSICFVGQFRLRPILGC